MVAATHQEWAVRQLALVIGVYSVCGSLRARCRIVDVFHT